MLHRVAQNDHSVAARWGVTSSGCSAHSQPWHREAGEMLPVLGALSHPTSPRKAVFTLLLNPSMSSLVPGKLPPNTTTSLAPCAVPEKHFGDAGGDPRAVLGRAVPARRSPAAPWHPQGRMQTTSRKRGRGWEHQGQMQKSKINSKSLSVPSQNRITPTRGEPELALQHREQGWLTPRDSRKAPAGWVSTS